MGRISLVRDSVQRDWKLSGACAVDCTPLFISLMCGNAQTGALTDVSVISESWTVAFMAQMTDIPLLIPAQLQR